MKKLLDHLTRKQKDTALRILAAGALLLIAALLPLSGVWRLLVFLVPYGIVGWDVIRKSALNIIHGQVFDENFLMTIATVGALALGEYPEAVFVMLFYQVGELFQSVAVGRSRAAVAALAQVRPDRAVVLREGEPVETDAEDVAVGERMLVRPGARIPLDGKVEEGNSSLDTAALTGESMPRDVGPGDEVKAGCVNLQGVLTVIAERPYEESTVSRVLELVEESAAHKAKTERFITSFARVYTPAVVSCAVALAFLPPLISGDFAGNFTSWLYRALAFLVVSCPCAVVISVPLAFFGGIGGAGRRGILIKGSNCMETLAAADTVCLDKTGTLTEGRFSVTEIHPREGLDERALLALAAIAERNSDHPIARSLREGWKGRELPEASEAEELPGKGTRAVIAGRRVAVGNPALMAEEGAQCPEIAFGGTAVQVAMDGKYLGWIGIADREKPTALRAVESLKACGVRRIAMLTGDREEAAIAAADRLGIEDVYSELLPDNKAEVLEELMSQGGKVICVGDGINDAPCLALADVGIAMGGMGSDAAIEAADVVLMDDDPRKLAETIGLARRTLRIVRENVVFSIGIKVLVLVLSALSVVGLGAAVFADVGVAVLATLNSMRTLRK